MIESNIMNISVEPSEQPSDSENEETPKILNINLKQLECSKVYKNIENNPEESKSKKEESSNEIELKSLIINNSSEILEHNIKLITDGTIVFNGKEFNKTSRLNKYNRINKKDIIYYRREEKIRIQTKQGQFCNATIQSILKPNSNGKYKYNKPHNSAPPIFFHLTF